MWITVSRVKEAPLWQQIGNQRSEICHPQPPGTNDSEPMPTLSSA